MYTIPDMEKIAELATGLISEEFKEYKFSEKPPRITPGMVRIILQVYDMVQPKRIKIPDLDW